MVRIYFVWKSQHSPSVILAGWGGGGICAADPMVDMVGQGRVDLATATARMAPCVKNSFMASLSAKYPQYNQGTSCMRRRLGRNSRLAMPRRTSTNFNTAIEHAGQLSQATDALQNGDVRGLNK